MCTRAPVVALLLFATSGASVAELSSESIVGDRVEHAVWGVAFDAPGYELWEHPLRGQPNFIAAGNLQVDGCELHLSLFAVPAGEGTTPDECRRRLAGNPDTVRSQGGVLLEETSGTPAMTRFDRPMEGSLVQNKRFGYWVRGLTCFELHQSAIDCRTFSEPTRAILDSFEVQERPYVDFLSMSAAHALGSGPEDWRVHQRLGDTFLHHSEPSATEARHYYDNALALAGSALTAEDRWKIHSGIGLAWLHEDDGERATTPLELALAATEGSGLPAEMREETLYNLTCALALSGRVDEACARASSLMSGLNRKHRKKNLEDMRRDPQL